MVTVHRTREEPEGERECKERVVRVDRDKQRCRCQGKGQVRRMGEGRLKLTDVFMHQKRGCAMKQRA